MKSNLEKKRSVRTSSFTKLATVGCIAALVTVYGCGGGVNSTSPTQQASSDPAVAMTQEGQVSGVKTNNIISFQGIPYAAAPVGALRFQAPQPAPKRSSALVATAPGGSCAVQEDCLYLNVWKPADAVAGEKLPVLFWIHGGGFANGSGGIWDGTSLAGENRFVVVTINYRLGGLGFFAHPAITAAYPKAPANFGLLDQQAAMKWVQTNIDAFGGDPTNVTVFGQSAGGMSLTAQLTSTSSAGLFQKAMVISNGPVRRDASLANAEQQGVNDAAALGCPGTDQATLDCLRNIPFAAFRSGTHAAAPSNSWAPVVDGVFLTESTSDAFAAGRFNKMPIIFGSMQNERSLLAKNYAAAPLTADNYAQAAATALNVEFPVATTADILQLYPASNYVNPTHATTEAVGDFGWYCGAMIDAQNLSKYSASIWRYEFAEQNQAQIIPDGSSSYPGPVLSFFGPWGNFHSADNPYWFSQFADSERTSSNLALSSTMRQYLHNFAVSGNPNGSSLPAWNSVSTGGGTGMIFATPIRNNVDITTAHHCDFWATKPASGRSY
ncbi:carboxylesterase family protein [Paraburkholderia sp. Ac-20342]|uniref:carboxylesterase/lipase family protein n=1 Tax=Paraburkholderia sp. Ac-20342 TaxID=2703889 RepID=UPI00198086E0|nr:carboxylesterase family protein [Paraburkholderia sp. Ac-20342]MBN3849568.1 carboxylesterase family protein [Paraburkholderia sp. Ac-20342]